MLRLNLALLLAVVLFTSGCQQASQRAAQAEPIAVAEPTPPPRVEPAPRPQPVVEAPKPPPLTDTRIIFFDFDRSDIRPEFRAVVTAHGQMLADMPSKRVRLEGHADERGSREYNIGLGERRAQAVRQALMLAGAKSSQIETRSYGEERPLDPGHTEYAWSQNRRVEFVY